MGSFLKKVADPQLVTLVKDTHREKAPSNKTTAFYKKYEYEYLGSWYIKSILLKRFLPYHIETRTDFIYDNGLRCDIGTDFYMITASVMKELTKLSKKSSSFWKNSVLCDMSILYSPFYQS